MLQTLPYYYTNKEEKALLSSLVVLIDTREQENGHITGYLDRCGVKWKPKKLDYGDYSFFLPAAPNLGIVREVYFTREIVIERKANLDELAGNLTRGRAAFEAELIRANGSKNFLLIESGSWADVIAGNYRSQYNRKSYLASLMAFIHRYGIQVVFTTKENAGQIILGLFAYYLRELIKG